MLGEAIDKGVGLKTFSLNLVKKEHRFGQILGEQRVRQLKIMVVIKHIEVLDDGRQSCTR